MATTRELEGKKAKHGERMIEVKIRFWTDKIAEGEGMIVPKHAWGAGMLTVQPNASHGISRTSDGRAFNSMLELPVALEKLLITEGIVVHPSRRMARYTSTA